MTIKLKHHVQKFNRVDAFNYCLNLLENLPGESTDNELARGRGVGHKGGQTLIN